MPVGITPLAPVLGDVMIDTTFCALPAVPRCSHSGFSVATTNSTATATVTACEKINQVLRIVMRL